MAGGRSAHGGATVAIAGALIALALAPGAVPAASHKPLTRYSIVHGCYELQSSQGAVSKQDGAYAVGSGDPEVFRMQATDLGRYLFYGHAKDFMAVTGGG